MTKESADDEALIATLQEASHHAKTGDWQSCLALCRDILDQVPEIISANYLAGIASIRLGKQDDAIAFLRASIEQYESDDNKLSMLCDLLVGSDRADEALPYLERLLALAPGPDVLNRLGAIHADAGRIGEAIIRFRQSLEAQPEDNIASAGLYPLLRVTCEWSDELDQLSQNIDQLNEAALQRSDTAPEPPFDNVHRVDVPQVNYRVARSWSTQLQESVAGALATKDVHSAVTAHRKIRIGYLSGDLHDHAIGHLMRGVFRTHDRETFEIRAYSHAPDRPSSYRDDIRRACDAFIDIREISNTAAANLIQADEIDILVDLMGYTRNNRLGICAMRPAPVQVTYLGFPGTTGSDFFDYTIVDELVAPPETSKYFGETLVYLPHAYQSNDNTQENPQNHKNLYIDILNNFEFIFCSFNNPIKIDQRFFEIWLKLLKSVPNSCLWLLQNNPRAVENLTRFAAQSGVSPKRLVFAEMLPRAEHLARMACADLGLDTHFYNGHTTTSDALWAGLPVVAMQGRHFASRVSASLLTAAGVPELVTQSPDQYAELALHLATHPDELSGIRSKIKRNRGNCALFDTVSITRDLESAYAEMWLRLSRGEAASTIKVASLD